MATTLSLVDLEHPHPPNFEGGYGIFPSKYYDPQNITIHISFCGSSVGSVDRHFFVDSQRVRDFRNAKRVFRNRLGNATLLRFLRLKMDIISFPRVKMAKLPFESLGTPAKS